MASEFLYSGFDLLYIPLFVLGREMSDIELCFRALYAAMLYRIKGEGGKSAVSDTIEYVSPVIAELADMYGKVERGEADLFKDTAPER